jgi:hypothetical protein
MEKFAANKTGVNEVKHGINKMLKTIFHFVNLFVSGKCFLNDEMHAG